MNGLMKAIVTMAPVFAVCLLIFLSLNRKFDFEFAREEVRFEQQFSQATGFKQDKWLKEQEKELERMKRQAHEADARLAQMAEELGNITVGNLTKDFN